MFYEINYAAYALIALLLVWVIGWPVMIFYDLFASNRFRPLYRLAWPIMIFLDLIS